MSEPGTAREITAPLPADDCVITFRTEVSRVRGRLVRLGTSADTILSRHKLPPPVAVALGQALGLAGLFGSALPAGGKIIVQTRTDGPVSLLVADFSSATAAGALRGYARFDAEAISKLESGTAQSAVLGSGSLAVTIDQGGEAGRYQAITALDDKSLDAAASAYFHNQDGAPALVRLAVAELYLAGRDGDAPSAHWRGGGLMMQPATNANLDDDDEGWTRVRTLAETVEDHELLDPLLSPERLLLRLFHEEGVRIERVTRLGAQCRCSRERIAEVLKSFGSDELNDMRDADGRITATCEFCASPYVFDAADIL